MKKSANSITTESCHIEQTAKKPDSPSRLVRRKVHKTKEVATRRDEPIVCAKCGKRTKRRMRGQKYCSRVCRERARQRSRKAFLGQDTRAPATPTKKLNGIKALAAAKRRSSYDICGPSRVIKSECSAGREWKLVISPDGVPAWVARRRKEPRNG
jgi:hypothetical protein